MEVRSKAIYDSCKMFSPSGELMCFISNRKAKWYLSRNLACKVADNPLAITLKFEPKALGHVGDKFYTTARENHCVACGILESLTLHHIVPYCYRRFFPETIKSHSSHDLVPLCLTCHNFYEVYAWTLKKIIADEYNAPLYRQNQIDRNVETIHKAARAIKRHLDGKISIPENKLNILRSTLAGYFDVEYHDSLIDAALVMNQFAENDEPKHGELVVTKIDIQEFVQRWRQHFVDILTPKFMPEAWCITRKIGDIN